MIVVVQDTKTRLFLGQAGGWVKDSAGARDFRRAAAAIAFCAAERLARVRVCIISDDPRETVYFQPESSRQAILEARNLRRRSRELIAKQQLLRAQVEAVKNEIAQQSMMLPMRRKKKRLNPPAEEPQ